MTRTLRNCPAPAKLNLFLHITGRRSDGYHLLQTVFQLIDRSDVLHFTSREDGLIRRISEIVGIPEKDDLVVRAARLLQKSTQAQSSALLGADIEIEKHLPMGGGLGGGSSDAATTLLALNHLWQTRLSFEELALLGLQLGADVPFFLFGQNAFAEGIGEKLIPIDIPERWYVVIEPGVSIPTAQIFASPELTRSTKPIRMTDFSMADISFGKNDLQIIATKLFPQVAEAIEWLSQYGNAKMTGSGACVFCVFAQEYQADEVLKAIRNDRWNAWKAKALHCHPLVHLSRS